MPTANHAQNVDWRRFRREMPVCEKLAYFDHAAVAPLPAKSAQAIAQWADDAADHGDLHWGSWSAKLNDLRSLAAEMLHADLDEIALLRNTTEGVNLVAEGFPWREGDNVVVPRCEFPTNLFPWLNLAGRGVETRLVDCPDGHVDLAALAGACDRRTRIIAASWVDFASGWRVDVDALAELAHSQGAYLFLDAIQGLGVFPLDARQTPVDFLAADGHKWLLGPEGAGLFYLRREHLDLLRPLGLGWNSVEHAGDFSNTSLDLKPTAARYEGGTYPMAGLIGLLASLRLLSEYPTEAIVRRVLNTARSAGERLRSAGAVVAEPEEGHASGIVSFQTPGRDPAEVRARCRKEGVVLSCRGGRLRISPHVYTNEEDIERLVDAIVQ